MDSYGYKSPAAEKSQIVKKQTKTNIFPLSASKQVFHLLAENLTCFQILF